MAGKLLAVWAVDAALLGGLAAAVLIGGREEGLVSEAGAGVGTGKTVALTFDDGPHPIYTGKLLEGLRERGIKASFFLMGSNAEENRDLVLQMAMDGHLIGNHGYDHEDMTKGRLENICASIEKTSEILEEITGDRPEYVRPPFGAWNEKLEDEVGLTPVFWSVDSLDWKYRDKAQIVSRVLSETEDGDVILMHDIFSASVGGALESVDTLLEQGYTFVTIDEVLVD